MINLISNFFLWLWDVIVTWIYSSIQLGFVLFNALIIAAFLLLVIYSFKSIFSKDGKNAEQTDE